MDTTPNMEQKEDVAPLVGASLLFFLVLGWLITFVFSADEPSFVAMIVGVPTALATPIVTITFLIILRRSKHKTLLHRLVFYGSATLLALWCVGLFVGVCSA
jgi:ABC-type sulfate transport system permease component